jgi:hypothetical protein
VIRKGLLKDWQMARKKVKVKEKDLVIDLERKIYSGLPKVKVKG